MSSTSDNEDRRRFSRIPFKVAANLYASEHHLFNVEVLDISLNGVLVQKPNDWHGQLHDPYELELSLDGADFIIKISVTVAHIDNTSIGFICDHIDLDSISHLKRLVELNLGDEVLLNRELSSLLH